MDVRRLLDRPTRPISLQACHLHGLPGTTLLAHAPWGVVQACFVRRHRGPKGAILLRGAASAHDLARSLHPGNSGLAAWLGALAPGPSAPPPAAQGDAWPTDADAAARALDEALLQAFGPDAQARADLLLRLAQAVLLREDAPEGRLRPFLPSGPRVQLLDLRRPNRHVAVFRKRAGGGAAPPCLRAIAGQARAVVSWHGGGLRMRRPSTSSPSAPPRGSPPMSASPSAPTSSAASPPSDTTWSAGSSEPDARALRALLAAAGPWSGHAGHMSLALDAPLDPAALPEALRPKAPRWRLALRRGCSGPTQISVQAGDARGWRMPVGLGDLDLPPPETPAETAARIARALDAALCPLTARRGDLVLLLARRRLLETDGQKAILRRHGRGWILSWAGRRRGALPGGHRWRVLLHHWMDQARRARPGPDGLPRIESLHLLPIHRPPDSAHARLALDRDIADLEALLSLPPEG